MNKKLLLTILLELACGTMLSHPLGIFSTNRYTRIELAGARIRLHYVMDIAEIPSIQEITFIDSNKDGTLSERERQLYAGNQTGLLLDRMQLVIDGTVSSPGITKSELSFPEGQGGLRTVRLSAILEAAIPRQTGVHNVYFNDSNFVAGRGWKEIVVEATAGEKIQECSVPGQDVTDELRRYPGEMLSNPLQVMDANVRFIAGTNVGSADRSRQGIVEKASDGLAELISARELSPSVIMASLLIAMVLGAGHALTPGHGKTVVASYLVGTRGTAKHALFLGLTVTATHTIGVFAMGLVALFASEYVLPETLFPWLGLISGLIIVGIGVSLFTKRIRTARGKPDVHSHEGQTHSSHEHTHNGHTHSHLPPGSDGTPVTWKSLFALGVSGGLLPCPSAIVVLLSAIALGRIGFGLLLIVAFSTGLAGVLTLIGLLMVHARRYFDRFNTGNGLLRWLPAASALVVAIAGIFISMQAFGQTGVQIPMGLLTTPTTLDGAMKAGALSILGLGFVLGLKHALDTDHLIAVSTIVSERKGFFSSSIVGALWGLGHTASLLIVGLVMIALHIRIPEKVAQGMEFAVAGMLVALGINVIVKLIRGGTIHAHSHNHAGFSPVATRNVTELIAGILPSGASGSRSVLIGMVHGLAGSAALMLVVLATISSPGLALGYITVFGLGSVGGMLVMSTLIGIPFVLTAAKSDTMNLVVRGLSGIISVGFGLFYAWEIGIVGGLFL